MQTQENPMGGREQSMAALLGLVERHGFYEVLVALAVIAEEDEPASRARLDYQLVSLARLHAGL